MRSFFSFFPLIYFNFRVTVVIFMHHIGFKKSVGIEWTMNLKTKEMIRSDGVVGSHPHIIAADLLDVCFYFCFYAYAKPKNIQFNALNASLHEFDFMYALAVDFFFYFFVLWNKRNKSSACWLWQSNLFRSILQMRQQQKHRQTA